MCATPAICFIGKWFVYILCTLLFSLRSILEIALCKYVGLQPFYYSHGFPSHNLFNCLAHSESLAILTTAAARFLTHIPYTHESLSVGWIVMKILIQRECASH